MIWKSMSLPCTTSTTTWENRLLSSMKYGIGITGWTTSCIKKNFCASWRFLSVRFTYKPWSMVPHCKDRKTAWLHVPIITIDLPSDLQCKKIKARVHLVMTMWNSPFRSHFGVNQTVQGLRKLSFPEAVLWRFSNSKKYELSRLTSTSGLWKYFVISYVHRKEKNYHSKNQIIFWPVFFIIFTDLSPKDITNFERKPDVLPQPGSDRNPRWKYNMQF